MKRFRRYIFNTLTVVSLLLMLGVVGLWVDSIWYECEVDVGERQKKGDWSFTLVSSQGAVGLNFFQAIDDRIDELFFKQSAWRHKPLGRTSIWPLGFKFQGPESSQTRWRIWNRYMFQIPDWFLAVTFAILPAIWLFKWNKRRKFGPNACPSCGYDLTGNETGKCPECGVS